MTDKELALQVAVLRLLFDRVKAGREVLAGEVRDAWDAETRIPAVLPDGTRLGTVTLANGRVTARVTDQDALLAWVKSEHPHQVEETVRKQFMTLLTKRVTEGEVIPGMEVSEGNPYPTVKTADGADGLLAQAIRDGLFDWSMVPQITGGTEE